ncbi:hypothetical protein INS49_007870 [Diaporthe citri]|uniref:uncharacterized protein n=1 Tax=Diaporthe citri TaxID=83186 RepID=UPI001C7E1D5B|nr:uncharacterized protein INS49_007870 [Diaporthe citri]KAG6362776.1 hypothetical protein INS49_007870 [Diaporthe citri]
MSDSFGNVLYMVQAVQLWTWRVAQVSHTLATARVGRYQQREKIDDHAPARRTFPQDLRVRTGVAANIDMITSAV